MSCGGDVSDVLVIWSRAAQSRRSALNAMPAAGDYGGLSMDRSNAPRPSINFAAALSALQQ